MREAVVQSEKILEAARAEEAKIKEEILVLRRTRRQVVEGIRFTVEGFQRLVNDELRDEGSRP